MESRLFRISGEDYERIFGNKCAEIGYRRVIGNAEEKVSTITVLPDIQPFVTDHITGEPIEIRSRRHKRDVLKRHSVVEYDVNSRAKNRGERSGPDKNFKWEVRD